ncbi:AAA family ATPase [Serratia ureilytica]|uniref:UvrD-helicase domain-containing protein n=1 Tax=Serratia ureilytica TaxID=300181 RepID=UPI0011CC576D|nr:UvrD-helicase domain-containing protein [Serratia ureilytica]TXE51223.1 AAA family ATPase [Serratia ureilytica]
MSYSDTPERTAVIGWFGHRLVVRAFAGTGKTSILVLFALANPDSRMLYLAYSRAARDEAIQKFPFNVVCMTSHQLAWPNFGLDYEKRLTGNPRITGGARLLNILHWPLTNAAAIFNSAVNDFGPQHLLVEKTRSDLSTEKMLAEAQLLWRESACQDGTFPVMHDVYLKQFQLSQPDLSLRWQTPLFDKAQNANPVKHGLVLTQLCNMVLVGDRHQQIYRFRGAESALDAPALIDADRLNLTNGFRCGLAVVRVANMLLARQGETVPVIGDGGEDCVVSCLTEETQIQHVAVLSRTVAGVICTVLNVSLGGKKVFWVGDITGYKTEEPEDLYWFLAGMPDRMRSPALSRGYRDFEVYESVAKVSKDREMNLGLRLLAQYFPLLPEDERTDGTNLLNVAVICARKTLVMNALLQALLDEEAVDDRGGGAAAC